MTIRSTPNNGGFQLSDAPFFSYYLLCLIKSSFIMTLRLRYQTFKNKPKHTGISSDIINKRSMGNWACTSRFICLVWKRAGPIVKVWAIPMVRFGPKFPLFSPHKPALWAFLFCWLSFSFSRLRLMFGVSPQTDRPMLGLTWNTNYGNVKTCIHLWMKKT